MRFKKLLAAILTVTLASLSLTSIASAQTPDPITTTVPVFGTSLVIEIVTDATTGDFQSATISAADPSDAAAVATAANFVPTSETEHGGFEVKFLNSADGVKIEVNVVDGAITKTEVEAHTPGDAGGSGLWTGDPLGNGDTVTVAYDIVVDPGTGDVTIANVVPLATNASSNPIDTFFNPLSFDQADVTTSSHEGETVVTYSLQIYNSGIGDGQGGILADSQDSVNLVIRAKVEHGQLEVEVAVVDPSSNRGRDDDDDDDESDDHESDDDRGDDHESDDDESDDDRGDDRGDNIGDSDDRGSGSDHSTKTEKSGNDEEDDD